MAFFKGRRETSSQSRPGVAEELGDMGAGLYLLTPSSGFAIAMPTGTLMVIGGVPAVGLKVYYRYHSVDKSYMFWTLSTLSIFRGFVFLIIYIYSHHSIRRAVLFFFHFSIFYFPSITVPLLVMSFCELCWRGFGVPANFSKHLASAVHARGECFQCNECARKFSTKGALGRHRRNLCEMPEVLDYHCAECRRDFTSPGGLKRHLSKMNIHTHTQGSEPAARYACQECGRIFATDRALTCHVQSGIHAVTQRMRCFNRNTCGKSFTAVSGMVYHLESGACTKDFGKERLLREITARDTENLIITSNPQTTSPISEHSQLPTPPPSASSNPWPTEEETLPHFLLPSSIISPEGEHPYSTPLTSDPQFANILTCPLCKSTRRRGRRRKFKSAAALQAHLDEMGAHTPEPYVYPGGARKFMTLGSLVRHAEDRAKEGGKEGRAAEEVIGCVKGWLEEAGGGREGGWRGRDGDGEAIEAEE